MSDWFLPTAERPWTAGNLVVPRTCTEPTTSLDSSRSSRRHGTETGSSCTDWRGDADERLRMTARPSPSCCRQQDVEASRSVRCCGDPTRARSTARRTTTSAPSSTRVAERRSSTRGCAAAGPTTRRSSSSDGRACQPRTSRSSAVSTSATGAVTTQPPRATPRRRRWTSGSARLRPGTTRWRRSADRRWRRPGHVHGTLGRPPPLDHRNPYRAVVHRLGRDAAAPRALAATLGTASGGRPAPGADPAHLRGQAAGVPLRPEGERSIARAYHGRSPAPAG